MPAVLGAKAMQALQNICAAMGLQYAGIDFALSPDGYLNAKTRQGLSTDQFSSALTTELRKAFA